MTRLDRRWIATGVWLATLALSAVAIAFLLATLSARLPPSWGFRGASILFGLSAGSIGALVARRRPENTIGWLFAAIGICFALEGFIEEYTIAGVLVVPGRLPFVTEIGWLLTWIWVPSASLALIFLPLVFPTGWLSSRRWRAAVGWGVFAVVEFSAAMAVAPGPIQQASYLDNPLGLSGLGATAFVERIEAIAVAPVVVGLVAAIVSIVGRFRSSSGETRQQLKWFAFAAAGAAVIQLVYFASYLLSPDPAVVKGLEVLLVLSLMCLPIAAGIAVLRYRLYEIDRIISRTVSYAVVTGVLVAVYAAGFALAQSVLATFTSGGGSFAVAASALVVFAIFQPLRRRVSGAMDRRFNRTRYDAARTVEGFAARLRDEVDLDRLGDELRTTIGRNLAPSSVGVWLRSSHRTAGR